MKINRKGLHRRFQSVLASSKCIGKSTNGVLRGADGLLVLVVLGGLDRDVSVEFIFDLLLLGS